MNAQLSISRMEARVSPDPVSHPDYLLTTLDGDRVVDSMRYGDRDVAEYGIDRVRQWVAEDLQRHEAWERDDWQFLDVRLVAVAEIRTGERVVGSIEIDGPALGGVESDAGDEYVDEVVAELAGEFRAELAEMGFDNMRDIEPSPTVCET